jgi:hypothetical protein
MKRLFLAGALVFAMLVPASAVAAPHHPTGEFAQFGDCPLSRATLTACLFSESSAGSYTIGKKNVPIVHPVVLQGGLEWKESILEELPLIAAEDGNTLVKTPQPVPGGLLGIEAPSWWPSFLKNLFNETINNGFTGVTATVEIAGSASSVKLNSLNLLLGSGTALALPAKIKLDNPFLGSSCYIGSNSNPVQLNFTTGTTSPPPPNTPITGNPGTASENASGTLVTFSGGRLVNNSYAAPGANGCGGLFSFLIDPFVNSIVGLPSPAGTNTAILEGVIKIAEPAAVRASE